MGLLHSASTPLDLLQRHLLPAAFLEKGLAAAVANTDRADPGIAVPALDPFPQHRVEGGGSLLGTLDLMPGQPGRLVGRDLTGLDELPVSGDRAVIDVDEEPRRHRDNHRYTRDLVAGARRLRPLARRAWHGGAD